MNMRVHFADGAKVDVDAASSDAAVKAARARHPQGHEAGRTAIVSKVKVVRASK